MTQHIRVGARKRSDENQEQAAQPSLSGGPEFSPHSGAISGLADIAELGSPAPHEPAAPSTPEREAPAGRHRVADTDLTVSPVALGTSVFGWTLGAETANEVLGRYRELGGNFIDTADSYASGRSEHLIGSWMRAEGCRDEMVLSTKIGRDPEFRGLGAVGIEDAVNASLRRLRTDRIDVLTFHVDDRDVELEESLSAVDALMRAGKVRYLAASNFTAERLLEARVLAANGLPRFRMLQTNYSLLHRTEYESALALVARAQGLAVMPYFALANGFLAGGYRSRASIKSSTRGLRVGAHLNRRGARVLSVMDRIAGDFNVQLATIAIAWLQAKSSVCAPVVGVSSAAQLDAVMAASAFRLSRTDMIELDRATAAN